MLRSLLIGLVVLSSASAQLRILAIGDSLTEEYAFEIPFAAPDSDPSNSNARNWPELLRIWRPTEATLGSYAGNAGSYYDLRNGGHAYNFGVPGYTTLDWIKVLNQAFYNPFQDNAQKYLWYRTRNELVDQLTTYFPSQGVHLIETVVIFLGGNDLKQDYDEIYTGSKPQGFYDAIVDRLSTVHDFVRSRRPNVPIIVCTIPDVGATPEVAATFPDSELDARDRIAALNQDIATTFNALSRTSVARIDQLTDQVFDQRPFQLNGTFFSVPGHPENPPERVFCKDDFHPNTAAQALILDQIIAAIDTELPGAINPFPNREILSISGLNPDQPYLDFVSSFPLTDADPAHDPDSDGLATLVEMGLGTDPTVFSAPLPRTFAPGSPLTWTPSPSALNYLDLVAEESATLNNWTPVPASRLSTQGDSLSAAPPPGATVYFAQLRATPKP